MSDSEGIVGWWPLHDDTAQDYSGNGNHGTLNGGVTTGVAGRGGLQAMSFDGGNDIIDITKPSLDNSTWSFWIKLNSVNTGSVQTVTRARTPDGYNLKIDEEGGTLTASQYDGSSWQSSSFGSVTTEKWYHIVVTNDSENSELTTFLDSSVTGSTTTAYNDTNDIGFSIGASPYDANYSNIILYDFRIYNYVLSSSEIQTLYEWGSQDLARPRTDGTSYYKLDGDATDSWGSNDGTTYGGVSWVDGVRGQAVSLDGSDDEIVSSNTVATTDYMTVSAWVKKPTSTTDNEYAVTWGPDSNNLVTIFYYGSSGQDWCTFIQVGGSNNIIHTGILAETGWNHFAIVITPSEHISYANGVEVGRESHGFTPSNIGDGNFYVGARPDGKYYDGNVDDVRIYPFALEPWEVHDLYRYGTFGTDQRRFLVRA